MTKSNNPKRIMEDYYNTFIDGKAYRLTETQWDLMNKLKAEGFSEALIKETIDAIKTD